jgi:hypothetical protein
MTGQPPVVAMAELIVMLDVTRRRVATIVNGDDFPVPIATLSVGRIWSYDEVKAWARRTGRKVHPLPGQ